MATQIIDKKSNITSLQNVSYIRGMDIEFSASGCKPNTQVFPFFDGQRVDEYITPSGEFIGSKLITTAAGNITGIFSIPGFTFTTGDKKFILSESPTSDEFSISNNVYVSQFKTTSVNSLFAKVDSGNTLTNVSRIRMAQTPIAANDSSDPVAQSFNTYGVSGGCFIQYIELFFQNKENSPANPLPVTVDVRAMVNGIPSSNIVTIDAICTLPPENVYLTTAGGDQYTRFNFSKFIYLAEDQEYCFVVSSNSTQYKLYAANNGAQSYENGSTIFEQPNVGSVFKSQNGGSWVQDAFTTLKFNIGTAKFTTNAVGIFDIVATSPSVAVSSKVFTTTNSSATIRANLPFKHALGTGHKINISVDTNGTYNGITGANINGTWDVVTVVDPYIVEFNVSETANTTGSILHGGTVQEIFISDPGSGYTTPPTVTFSDPVIPSNRATGTPIMRDGKLMRIEFNTSGINSGRGLGYTSTPTITITPNGFGSGAVATAYLDQKFGVTTNRFINTINPALSNFIPSGTEMSMYSTPTIPAVVGDSVISQQYGIEKKLDINLDNNIENTAIILSQYNEIAKFSSNNSAKFTIKMSTTNQNVSPVFDRTNMRMMLASNIINNQQDEIELGLTNTELSDIDGTAVARDVTYINTLSTVSTSATVYVTAYSSNNTSFEVYIRTSLSANNIDHKQQPFVLLTCDEDRHKSTTRSQYYEYKFYTATDLPEFDVYDLKIVLRSKERHDVPAIANYRAILTA